VLGFFYGNNNLVMTCIFRTAPTELRVAFWLTKI